MASGVFNFQAPSTSRSPLPSAIASEDECRRIHGLLFEAREGVALLTAQIEDVMIASNSSTACKRKLIARCNRLNEFIDAHLAAVSVTRRIPEDVLREIFLSCVSFVEPPALDPGEPPLVLCRISREWRSLALSMPRLWAAIKIGPLSHGQCERLQQIADAAKKWLSRSGSLPLTIAFIGQSRLALIKGEPRRIPVGTETLNFLAPSHDATPTYDTLLRTLTALAPRWKAFTFHVAEAIHLRSLAHLSPHDVPMLQSVSIHCDEVPGVQEALPFLSAGTIICASIRPSYLAYRNPLPWETILDLTIQGGHFLSHILRQCSLLETCTLWNMHNAYAVPGGPVHVQRLHTLSIMDGDTGPFESSRDFYDSSNLILPSLRHLKYHKSSGWARINLAIEPVLVSCGSTLQSLDLSVCMSMTAFVNALQAVRHLEELTIQSEPTTGYTDELQHLLVPLTPSNSTAGAAAVLCPRLRSLALLNFGSRISDEMLLQFIRERTESGGEGREGREKLVSVKTRFNRERELDVVASLKDRIAEGLGLDLGYVQRQRFTTELGEL